MRNVAIITYRSKKYGEGHFMRSQSLAQKISKNNNLYLVVNDLNQSNHKEQNHYKKIFNYCNNEDVSYFEENFSANDVIWFDLPYEKNLLKDRYKSIASNFVGINMFGRNINAFEKISFFPKYSETKREVINGGIEISGKNCLTVSSDFFSNKGKKDKQIIVSMGGGDPLGFTEMLLPMLLKLNVSDHKIKIILPRNLSKHDYQEFSGSKKYIYNFAEIDFSKELKKSSLAIINGGITRYECIAAKTFFIALSMHRKQYKISEEVTKHGLGCNFGVFKPDLLNKLKSYIENNYLLDNFPISKTFPELEIDSDKWMFDTALNELGLK